MRNKFSKYICFILFFLSISSTSYAVKEAGEFRKKESKTPHANFFVTNDITNIKTPEDNPDNSVEEIVFSADEMTSDDKQGIVTAKGNVEIEYNNMRLKTDKLIYNQKSDIVTAVGNVKMHTSDGAIIYSDEVSLSDNMSVGEMHNIKMLMRDKSHVIAGTFRKKDNQTKVLTDATYTACDLCEGKLPLWEVSARKVQHDERTKNVNYNNAVLKFKGVPAFYTPFLTHPDPTVKRRSGLLPPTFGSSSYLGTLFQPRYFWAVNDQTNVIFSPIFSNKKDPVWGGAYKQYFYNSFIDISGSYLKDNEENRPTNRGNLFVKGVYDINDYWRMKYDWKYVSDYIYLKDLNLPYDSDAWLTSNIAFERFSGRDYTSVEAYYYKMLSYNLHQYNQQQFREINNHKPIVAPLIDAEFYSDPDSYGSYFKNEFNGASIYHRSGSQTQRLTSINSWELPLTSAFGEKYRFVASLKSDAYYVKKYDYLPNDRYTGTTTRFFPQAGVEWRLPFVRASEDSRQIIEPVIVAVLAPDGGNKINKIPNEDSEDVYFDDTNVLDLNRYAGYDRNDSGSRISYGLRWNSYGDIFGRTSAFVAQSLERNKDSSFIESLDNKDKKNLSDFVGRVNASPNKYLDLNYRFRLDNKTMKAKYNELNTSFGPSFLKANVSYIFLQGNTHYNNLYSERKELYTSLSSDISQYWSVSVYNLRDLTSNSRGNLEHGGTLSYNDECFGWNLVVRKYNSSNPNLENDYEFTMTFYLKTIGSFGS